VPRLHHAALASLRRLALRRHRLHRVRVVTHH
jgi:hypothetical protein